MTENQEDTTNGQESEITQSQTPAHPNDSQPKRRKRRPRSRSSRKPVEPGEAPGVSAEEGAAHSSDEQQPQGRDSRAPSPSGLQEAAAVVSEPQEPVQGPEPRDAGLNEGQAPGTPVQKKRRRRRRKSKHSQEAAATPTSVSAGEDTEEPGLMRTETDAAALPEPAGEPDSHQGAGKRKRRRKKRGKKNGALSESQDVTEPSASAEPKDRTKRILINAGYPEEKRVAILEGDRLMDFYTESASRVHLRGNIYKGIVETLMPSLQAAFVDFGQKKRGFLQYREVMPELRQGDDQPLVEGQQILVQVEQDERDTKGASLTTFISIPGRYIVMLPGQQKIGVSRKIENRADRDRLKETFNALKLPKDMGFILRTACGDSLEDDLDKDLKYLTKLWSRITADAKRAKAPKLIYQEQDITLRTLRDYLTSDTEEILIDESATLAATQAFLKRIMPWRKVNVVHYAGKKPIFSLYNIEQQIADLSLNRVTLPSRGSIVIDKTEAMTAIDVNSGKSRKEESIEATALSTNLEAAEEIARQLRLRDIGGLIVIDFIDMVSGKNRRHVEMRLEEALSDDKASLELSGISRFGLLEMTRERLRPAYAQSSSRNCPLCSGKGVINSDDFVNLSALREIHALAATGERPYIACHLSIDNANAMNNTKRRELASIEQEYQVTIQIVADPSMQPGQYKLDAKKHK
ncbi:MAG TPA: Rne/Rng family ribonuclease [Dissulfurispiraceae bacterium]|nr:Rne/Rng family ribonuclease [Dissulfurispiraceae bacterium]